MECGRKSRCGSVVRCCIVCYEGEGCGITMEGAIVAVWSTVRYGACVRAARQGLRLCSIDSFVANTWSCHRSDVVDAFADALYVGIDRSPLVPFR
jgi:hypothetical protein